MLLCNSLRLAHLSELCKRLAFVPVRLAALCNSLRLAHLPVSCKLLELLSFPVDILFFATP